MKQIILFAFTAMLMGGCDHSNHQHGAGTEQEFYGQPFDGAHSIPVSSLATQLSGKDTLETVIEGVINQTCPHAGCWLDLKLDNGQNLKITTDHVFFVPVSGCEGLKAKVKGKAFHEITSVEDLKHYAGEEGKTAEEIAMITEPMDQLTFVATGVMIEGYNETADNGKKPESCTHDHKEGEEHDHEHEHGAEHKHPDGSH